MADGGRRVVTGKLTYKGRLVATATWFWMDPPEDVKFEGDPEEVARLDSFPKCRELRSFLPQVFGYIETIGAKPGYDADVTVDPPYVCPHPDRIDSM